MLQSYLNNSVIITDDLLKSEHCGCGTIMSSVEDEIMRESAQILQPSNAIVLNVGFGLGIIDRYIREMNPKEHHIIEAHPMVCEKAIEMGFDVVCDKWENKVLEYIENDKKFDAIYFDTFVFDFKKNPQWAPFTKLVPQLLKTGGIYSFFNNSASKIEKVEGILADYNWQRKSKMLNHPNSSKPYELLWYVKTS